MEGPRDRYVQGEQAADLSSGKRDHPAPRPIHYDRAESCMFLAARRLVLRCQDLSRAAIIKLRCHADHGARLPYRGVVHFRCHPLHSRCSDPKPRRPCDSDTLT